MRVILVLLLFIATGVFAQEDEPTRLHAIESLIGEWQVESSINIQAYLSKGETVDEELFTTTGISKIETILEETALIEYYNSTLDGQLYEQTIFRGPNANNDTYQIAFSDTVINALFLLTGKFDDDGRISSNETGRTLRNPIWHTSLTINDDDSFTWELSILQEDTDPIIIWTKHYTRMDTSAYESEHNALYETYTAPPPLANMSDFHFWLGTWHVQQSETQEAIDLVKLTNAGHTMLEFMNVQNMDAPRGFFTMTIWDMEEESYHNWFWHNQASSRSYRGGTCNGEEGENKVCRLAGRFYNITDNRIEWSLSSQHWIFTRIEDE